MIPGIGWTELLLIAALAIIVVGPKDLPVLMRNVGRFLGKARVIAREFQDSFEEMAREAELEELRKEATEIKRQTGLSEPLAPLGPVVEDTAEPLSANEEAFLTERHNASILDAERLSGTVRAAPVPQEPVQAPEPAEEGRPSEATAAQSRRGAARP